MISPMNCTQAEEFIQHGVDGELTLAERKALDTHLDSCVACRRTWDAQRRLAQIADRWAQPTPADDPGDAFTAAVLAQIAARPAAVPRHSVYSLWLPLAVLLCLGAAFVLLPRVSLPDFSALELSARLLPHWLLSNLSALPREAAALTRTSPSYALPHSARAVLLLVLALNSVFVVQARRGRPQRSVS